MDGEETACLQILQRGQFQQDCSEGLFDWLPKFFIDMSWCDMKQNTNAIAVENRRKSGEAHWLIMPTRHIRDIEALTENDIPLCK